MCESRISPPLDSVVEITRWRIKLKDWSLVRKGIGEPCWLCDERECATYESPDLSLTQDWAYDICRTCLRKMGFDW